jgi:hypothetical protein
VVGFRRVLRIHLLTDRGYRLERIAPLLGRAACGAIALVIAAFLLRARRAGIEVGSHDLVVRRYAGRATLVPWDDVSCFKLVRSGIFNGGVYVAVVLRDGRTLTTQGLAAASLRSANGRALVEQLESSRPGGSA